MKKFYDERGRATQDYEEYERRIRMLEEELMLFQEMEKNYPLLIDENAKLNLELNELRNQLETYNSQLFNRFNNKTPQDVLFNEYLILYIQRDLQVPQVQIKIRSMT